MNKLPYVTASPGIVYSFTFSCHKRLSLFIDSAIYDLFEKNLGDVRNKHRLFLIAWVIMPNHVHILLTPSYEIKLSSIARDLKQKVGYYGLTIVKTLDQQLYSKLVVTTGTTRKTRFWLERRGYVRPVSVEEDIHILIDYIHRNPERWKLVTSPEDWLYSSARYWLLGDERDLTPNPPEWLMDMPPTDRLRG